MTEKKILTDFLKNAKELKMTVVRDEGLNRHLVFKNSGSYTNWFEIVTWAGCLTINGDHGTWIFSRIEDMFAFFRTKPEKAEDLYINPHYWQEKLLAVDKHLKGAEAFNVDTFRDNVIDSIDNYDLEGRPDGFKDRLIEALDEEVFSGDNEYEVRDSLNKFSFSDENSGYNEKSFEFSDTWEIEGTEYCYRYIYCLYAIVWAIQQYDSSKTVTEIAISA